MASLCREPFGPFLHQLADPEDGLDVVDKRRPAEQTNLRREWRPVARQTALPLDALQHRALLAADVSSRAASQMDAARLRETRLLDFGDLAKQQFTNSRIFVAQVNVNVIRLDRPRADQHPLQHAMGIASHVVAILEGARLPLVGVDDHQARLRLLADETPLASRREARAPQPAQPGRLDDADDLFGGARAVAAGAQQTVSASGGVGREIDSLRDLWFDPALLRGLRNPVDARADDFAAADENGRRLIAAADAGRAHDAHPGSDPGRQRLEQPPGAHHLAGQPVADPHGQRGRRRLPLLDDVEVGVEGCDLEHLGHRQPHLLGQRPEVRRREVAVAILDEMEVFDQKITAARAVAQQGGDLIEGGLVNLAPAGLDARLAPARSRMAESTNPQIHFGHGAPHPFRPVSRTGRSP